MIRKLIYQLHLCLGLATGCVLCFVSLTGCLLAFEDEIKNAVENFHTLPPHRGQFLSIEQLRNNAAKAPSLPSVDRMGCRIDFRGRNYSAIVMFFGPEGLYYCYVNPYTGKVMHVTDMSKDIFRIIRAGHRTLFLGNTGKTIIGYCTLLFFFILLSGLFLWWPRRWKKPQIKASFQIKWSAGKKRLSYELHKVMGFYTLLPAWTLAITGLVIGFPWFAQGYYALLSGGKSFITVENIRSDSSYRTASSPRQGVYFLDSLARRQAYQQNGQLACILPQNMAAPLWIITNPLPPSMENTERRFYRRFTYYDQYTLNPLTSTNIEHNDIGKAFLAEKLIRVNYDLHTGRLLGLPSKILFFVSSLICCSLPITGVLIWKNRRFKKRRI